MGLRSSLPFSTLCFAGCLDHFMTLACILDGCASRPGIHASHANNLRDLLEDSEYSFVSSALPSHATEEPEETMDLQRRTGVYGLFAYLFAIGRLFFRPIEQALKTATLLARLAALTERTRVAEANAGKAAENFAREVERYKRRHRALTTYLDATLREMTAIRTAIASRDTLAAAQSVRMNRLEATVRRLRLAEECSRPCRQTSPPRRITESKKRLEGDSVYVSLITRLHAVLQRLIHLSRKAHVSAADITGLLFDVREAGRIGRGSFGIFVPSVSEGIQFFVCLAPDGCGALCETVYFEGGRAAFEQAEERALGELMRLLMKGSTRGCDVSGAETHVRGMSVLAFQAAWTARLHKELFFPNAQTAG